ncbi:MAG: class I SAM-dependent methyltransferase [Acidobacteria bacterium]|nr:class I SAM-dependent methyltransferase [Acidobacteriota bacterium]
MKFATLLFSICLWVQAPNRDTWQRPAYVMDELGLAAGSVVADVGAGDGYFTFHLADRVGNQGMVYAVDIKSDVLETIENKKKARGFTQITTVLGAADDPRLPVGSLDAILIVNAYHEFLAFNSMLQAMYKALKSGGRLGIIETDAQEGLPREQYQKDHRLPESIVREDLQRNGFAFRNKGESFRMPNERTHEWYFVIFKKE